MPGQRTRPNIGHPQARPLASSENCFQSVAIHGLRETAAAPGVLDFERTSHRVRAGRSLGRLPSEGGEVLGSAGLGGNPVMRVAVHGRGR